MVIVRQRNALPRFSEVATTRPDESPDAGAFVVPNPSGPLLEGDLSPSGALLARRAL
jgi:hypothetical protein